MPRQVWYHLARAAPSCSSRSSQPLLLSENSIHSPSSRPSLPLLLSASENSSHSPFTTVSHYLFTAKIDGTLVIRSRNCQKTKNMNFHHKSFKMMSFKKKLKIALARSVTKQCMCTHCTVYCTLYTMCTRLWARLCTVFSKLRCAFQPFLKTGPQKPNKLLDLFIYVKNVPRKIEPRMFFTGKIGFGWIRPFGIYSAAGQSIFTDQESACCCSYISNIYDKFTSTFFEIFSHLF